MSVLKMSQFLKLRIRMLYLSGVPNENPLLEAYSVDAILLNVFLMITTYNNYKTFFIIK